MLPIVAAMAMGSMAKQASRGVASSRGLGAGRMPGGDLIGMLTPMLDANRDGSMMDDVAGMLGKFMGGR